jgi:hypothetical protein
MANTIKIKKSSVPGKIPDSDSLVHGELAINYSDGILYYKTATNLIKSFKSNIATVLHSELGNLLTDDHTQYVHNSVNRTITAKHIFAPTTENPPFTLGPNAQGQLVTGLNADLLDGKHATDFYSSDNSPINFSRFEFSSQLSWTVVHNKNTDKFSERLVDSDGNQFFAKVSIIDNNSFRVQLTASTSGHVDVFFMT